jgi:hypothetical protein
MHVTYIVTFTIIILLYNGATRDVAIVIIILNNDVIEGTEADYNNNDPIASAEC